MTESSVLVRSEYETLPDAQTFADLIGFAPDSSDLIVWRMATPLLLPTGCLVACDGLMTEGRPFVESVSPGEYPVLLGIVPKAAAEDNGYGSRCITAFARVEFHAWRAPRS